MKKLIGSLAGSAVSGGINAIYNSLTYDRQFKDQQDWWYAQQKFLEEHNSPAYQSMLMRKAGLNPYSNISAQPLGNVNSQVPQVADRKMFDPSSVRESLLAQASVDLSRSQGNLFDAETAESEARRQNLISEWFLLEQKYLTGEIDIEKLRIEWAEILSAYEDGYTPTANKQEAHDKDMEFKDSEIAKNESQITLNEQLTSESKSEESKNYADISQIEAYVNVLGEEYAKLKRENKLGDQYDELFKSLEYDLKSLDVDSQRYINDKLQFEATQSELNQSILKCYGIDVTKLAPEYVPVIYRFACLDARGDISDDVRKSVISELSTRFSNDLTSYNNAKNPDFVSSTEAYELNLKRMDLKIKDKSVVNDAIMMQWQMAMSSAQYKSDNIWKAISLVAGAMPSTSFNYNTYKKVK